MKESKPSLSRGKKEFLIKTVDFGNKLGSLLHYIRGKAKPWTVCVCAK